MYSVINEIYFEGPKYYHRTPQHVPLDLDLEAPYHWKDDMPLSADGGINPQASRQLLICQ